MTDIPAIEFAEDLVDKRVKDIAESAIDLPQSFHDFMVKRTKRACFWHAESNHQDLKGTTAVRDCMRAYCEQVLDRAIAVKQAEIGKVTRVKQSLAEQKKRLAEDMHDEAAAHFAGAAKEQKKAKAEKK